MRTPFAIVAACMCVGTQSFNSSVDQVAVAITIHREASGSMSDLRKEDFRVFDDGHPVTIAVFAASQRPAHLLLLLDNSTSMTESLAVVRSAAHAFLGLMAPSDLIRLGTFSRGLRLTPTFSSADEGLLERLPIMPGANITTLYDALEEACTTFGDDRNRRIIIVLSDGADTGSEASARTVIQRATENDVTIYAVGLSSRYIRGGGQIIARAPDSTLRDIAEDTGGGYAQASASVDFSRLLAPMIDELRQQYTLGFTPLHPDGRIHDLVVTVRQPNVHVRARKHYVAPRQ